MQQVWGVRRVGHRNGGVSRNRGAPSVVAFLTLAEPAVDGKVAADEGGATIQQDELAVNAFVENTILRRRLAQEKLLICTERIAEAISSTMASNNAPFSIGHYSA